MTKKRIFLVLMIILIGIQFVRIDKTNPSVNPDIEFIGKVNPPQEIQNILKNSCYDCHSFETKYPWYSNISPVSWFLKNHIKEGRQHLNFSEWGNYSEKKANQKIEECAEEIEKGEMPMKSYTLIHKNASLDDADKSKLINWLKTQTKTVQ